MNLMKFETKQTMTLKEITDLLEVRHNDAMAVVRKLIENEEFGDATKISYRTTQGNKYDTYQLNKRQSIAVAARLNTSLLMRIIDRWQELEDQYKPKTQMEMVAYIANQMVEKEKEDAIRDERINRIEAKQTALEEGLSYFTILAYASYKGIIVDLPTAQRLGKKASALSSVKGIAVDKVRDPRFGYVNSYHESVLDSIICEML